MGKLEPENLPENSITNAYLEIREVRDLGGWDECVGAIIVAGEAPAMFPLILHIQLLVHSR